MWSVNHDRLDPLVSPADAIESGLDTRIGASTELSKPTTPLSRPVVREDAWTPGMLDLLRALKRRWRMAILGGALVTMLGGASAYLAVPPPKYTTSSLIYVGEKPPRYLYETRENLIAYQTYQQTQTTLVTSQKVLAAALAKVRPLNLLSLQKADDPLLWLSQNVDAEFPGRSEILTISMNGDQPNDIAILVNAVTHAYLKLIVEAENQERLARFAKLKQLATQYQEDLIKKRETYRTMTETDGSGNKDSVAATRQTAADNLFQTRQELFRIQSDIRQSRIKMRVLDAEQQRQSGQAVVRPPMVEPAIKDAIIAELESRLDTARIHKSRAMRIARSARDPAVATLDREIARLGKELDARRQELRSKQGPASREEFDPSLVSARAENQVFLKALEEQETQLRKQIETISEEMRSIEVKAVDSHWIEDEIQVANEVAKTVAAEVEAVKVELEAPPRIRLIEEASVPVPMDPKRRIKLGGLGAAGSLVCFLAFLSLWEMQGRRIDSSVEVVQRLGMRLVGSLPPPRRRDRRVASQGNRVLVESIDSIRTRLIHSSTAENHRVVMISSAVKGEGKTTLACHLATSLARAGRRTLLLDCDLRNPSVHRVLDLPPGIGICEGLRGEATFDSMVQATSMARLFMIAAGVWDATALSALAEGRLGEILDEARNHFDLIIVDSAPVLLVNDTLVASQHVDAVLFSILLDVSRVPCVQAAYESLASLNVRILGAVAVGDRDTERSLGYYHM